MNTQEIQDLQSAVRLLKAYGSLDMANIELSIEQMKHRRGLLTQVEGFADQLKPIESATDQSLEARVARVFKCMEDNGIQISNSAGKLLVEDGSDDTAHVLMEGEEEGQSLPPMTEYELIVTDE